MREVIDFLLEGDLKITSMKKLLEIFTKMFEFKGKII